MNDICFVFYFYFMDKFSKALSCTRMQISYDGLTIKLATPGLASGFGEMLIDSLNNNTIYTWKFQVIESNLFYAIGITSGFNNSGILYRAYRTAKDMSFDNFKYSHLYNGSIGALSRNIKGDGKVEVTQSNRRSRWKNGDIVKMTFDSGKKCLWYKINGKKRGTQSEFNNTSDITIAFSDIETRVDIKYRMAFACILKNDSIKILSFKMKKPAP